MLRCRKCRKCVIELLCLTTDESTDEDSAAVCSVWHVNVDSLPPWILTTLDQAQWTAGKLHCLSCRARLGGFNFIHRSRCPCGHDANVHLNKSRVDVELGRGVFIVHPRTTRPEMSPAAPPTVHPENHQDACVDASGGEDSAVSSLLRGLHCVPPCVEDGEGVAPFRSLYLCTSDLRTSMETRRRPSSWETDTEVLPGASRRRREKNQLKGQRRKQRRRERWLLSQSEPEGEEQEEKEQEHREDLSCTVCLDVFFRPHSCGPCGHVFCEPCLRTLAKDRHTKTLCPLCRTIISQTALNTELDQTVRTSFPKLYSRSQQNFSKAPCVHWPLPGCRRRFSVTPLPLTSHWHVHGSFTASGSGVATVCSLTAALLVLYVVFSDWTVTLLLVCVLVLWYLV